MIVVDSIDFVANVNGEARSLRLVKGPVVNGEVYFKVSIAETTAEFSDLGYIKGSNLIGIINIDTIRCSQKHKADPRYGTRMDFSRFPIVPLPPDDSGKKPPANNNYLLLAGENQSGVEMKNDRQGTNKKIA